MDTLSARAARRLALAAAGLARPRPDRPVRRADLLGMHRRLGAVQMDSVSVLARAHYLPAFSRLGGYDPALQDRLAYRDRALFEYWGHEASLLPVELHPLLRWRMRRAAERYETWGGVARLAREHPDYIRRVRAEVAARGPLRAAELDDEGQRRGGAWWSWSAARTALEFLFWAGELTTAYRRGFERVYDLTERVLPARVLAEPDVPEVPAHRRLLALAARACGVATAADLADYFRLPRAATGLVREMAADGELRAVQVEGWREPGYLAEPVRVPRRVAASALVSPFDPLCWHRGRLARLFGFDYRIEIYVPAAQRRHGYYVLPFLHGDALQARVDLKAERASRRLLVLGAWAEPGAEPAPALAAELARLAGWLGLAEVDVAGRGDLAGALRAGLTAAPPAPGP